MRIRTAIVWGTLGHAVVAGVACFALVAITTVMHHRVIDLSESMDRFRKSKELESELLLHRLAGKDEAARGTGSGAVHELMDEVERKSGPSQRGLVTDLRDKVGAYLEASTAEVASNRFVSTITAARRLSLRHLESANGAHARAAQADLLANVLGISMAVLLAVGVVGFLMWMWRSAVQPFLGLQTAMARFGSGDANARAPEDGPPDFRRLAHTFNETASGLQRARQDQLRYTGAVLHDLRTPLSAIQLATQFVPSEGPVPSERRVRELFTLIRRQVTRINGIVGDSLGMLRAQAGDVSLHLGDADAGELAKQSVEQFLSVTTHHRMQLDIPEYPVRLRCDKPRVAQLLNNLLSNAIKYSPPGSLIHIAVAELPNHWIEFSVSDEGRGIAPEDLERIFQPFQRAVSGHEEIPGVGLGLYVSQSVAEAHGGRLDAESELGKGTTFRALFPADPPVAR